jgi:predicted dehydrogenase
MLYRINAGYIPADSWVHDPEVGGGRISGEVCHFIDFLQFMADSEPIQISVAAISGELGKYRADDNLCLTLTFADGSVGTVLYTAQGSKAFSRERFEVFCEESAAVLEDFRQGQIVQGGRSRKIKKISMDMGYTNELVFFVKQELSQPEGYHELFRSLVKSTQATLKAYEALRTGGIVKI